MNFYDVINEDTKKMLESALDRKEEFMKKYIYEYRNFLKGCNEEEIKNLISNINNDRYYMSKFFYGHTSYSEADITFLNSIIALEVLGYTNIAEDLARLDIRFYLAMSERSETVELITKGIINKKKSEQASKPRNPLHDEIMLIIKATWGKYPESSKREIIKRIMSRYPGKVDEKTLNRWIKKAGIAPPRPTAYKNFSLVIPE
ncbi:hypothetical protein ACI5OA_002124 [Salmonella enterica subsp. enterica serovar Poona]